MAVFYPLQTTADWPVASIYAAIAQLAVDLGFRLAGSARDSHETDAQRIVDDFVRDHRIKRPEVIERLSQQRSMLLEQYERTEHRWENDACEIILVLANDNVIPFPDDDIENNASCRVATAVAEAANAATRRGS